MENITSFHGAHRFLSNFWDAPVLMDGYLYPTVEHAYQAAKTLDQNERQQVRECAKPGQTKRMGKTLTIREDWEQVKYFVMKMLVFQKFMMHTQLAQKLLETGDALLIEGNTWGDSFWGVDAKKGGQNHLGQILMDVRAQIRKLQTLKSLGE